MEPQLDEECDKKEQYSLVDDKSKTMGVPLSSYRFDMSNYIDSENFSKKITAVEDKIYKCNAGDDAKYKLLRDQITKLTECLSNEQAQRETYDIRKAKELKSTETNLYSDVHFNGTVLAENNGKIFKNADEKLFNTKIDCAKFKKIKEEGEKKLLGTIGEKIVEIEEKLEESKQMREENTEKLIKKIGTEFSTINTTIAKEQKLEEESHTELNKMIQDMSTKLTEALLQEKAERELHEETLIKFLEDACTSIERKLQQRRAKM